LENRVGLKLVTRLLWIGLNNTKEGILGEPDDGENVWIDGYWEMIQDICNTTVWGSKDCPVCWMCPYDTQTKTITTICLDNVRTLKVINSLKLLVDVCIPTGDGRELWKATVKLYCEAMMLLLIRDDLTVEQIHEFQWKVDQLAQGWFKIKKGDYGITNYIHDLHAGHISDYLVN
jgi:hypothetical protein